MMIENITEVWTALTEWITGSLPDIFAMFYAPETGFTLAGILMLVSVGLGIALLLLNIVKGFLKFR